jgi:hypothetical protein
MQADRYVERLLEIISEHEITIKKVKEESKGIITISE